MLTDVVPTVMNESLENLTFFVCQVYLEHKKLHDYLAMKETKVVGCSLGMK